MPLHIYQLFADGQWLAGTGAVGITQHHHSTIAVNTGNRCTIRVLDFSGAQIHIAVGKQAGRQIHC